MAHDDRPRYERYVAIGDSSTEGLDDPDGLVGYRGWANRLAERIAATQGSLLYANLGIRGRTTRQIRDEQLEPALGMRPDLVTLFAGTNDAVSRRFDPSAVAADFAGMVGALRGSGATVLSFTLPDLSLVMPAARRLGRRVGAMNEGIRAACAAHGALLVDFAAHPVASDPRLWSADRLHANAAGHARMAAALASALGLPGSDMSWSAPLPALPRPGAVARVSAEIDWARRYLIPWFWRHLRGRSSGDGLRPKRPVLAPVATEARPPRLGEAVPTTGASGAYDGESAHEQAARAREGHE